MPRLAGGIKSLKNYSRVINAIEQSTGKSVLSVTAYVCVLLRSKVKQ